MIFRDYYNSSSDTMWSDCDRGDDNRAQLIVMTTNSHDVAATLFFTLTRMWTFSRQAGTGIEERPGSIEVGYSACM